MHSTTPTSGDAPTSGEDRPLSRQADTNNNNHRSGQLPPPGEDRPLSRQADINYPHKRGCPHKRGRSASLKAGRYPNNMYFVILITIVLLLLITGLVSAALKKKKKRKAAEMQTILYAPVTQVHTCMQILITLCIL